jgi:hypothetical protein
MAAAGEGTGRIMSDELDELRSAVPGGSVITDPDVMEAYRRDETPAVTPGQPRCVVLASMRWADQRN